MLRLGVLVGRAGQRDLDARLHPDAREIYEQHKATQRPCVEDCVNDHHRHRSGLLGRVVPERPRAAARRPIPPGGRRAGYGWIELGRTVSPDGSGQLQDQLDAHELKVLAERYSSICIAPTPGTCGHR